MSVTVMGLEEDRWLTPSEMKVGQIAVVRNSLIESDIGLVVQMASAECLVVVGKGRVWDMYDPDIVKGRLLVELLPNGTLLRVEDNE